MTFQGLLLGCVLLGSTISTATGLGWDGWPFSVEHFSNHFWLKHGNSWEYSLCELQSCNIIKQMLFQPFQPGLKRSINQTNQKQSFPNRTQKTPTNPSNQKRLIPIEHDLNFPIRTDKALALESVSQTHYCGITLINFKLRDLFVVKKMSNETRQTCL